MLAEASSFLKLSTENLERILAEKKELPLARTASRDEAELVFNRLRNLGSLTLTLSDDDLGLAEAPVKHVRSMSLDNRRISIQQPGAKEATEIC